MSMSPLLTAALSALLAAPSVPPVPESERPRLDAGEVVIHPRKPQNDAGFAVTAYAVVKAPIDRIWPHLRDCDRYAEFMPRAKASALRAGSGLDGVCYIEIGMPFPFSDLWAENASSGGPLAGGGFERRWKLARGTYSKNEGVWRVVPWSADASLVVYELEAAPDTPLPDALLRKAQGGALPDVFTAIRKRVGAAR